MENIIDKGIQVAKGLVKEATIRGAYEMAKDRYAAIGVNAADAANNGTGHLVLGDVRVYASADAASSCRAAG